MARRIGPGRTRGLRGLGGSVYTSAPSWTPASLTNLRGWYRGDDLILSGSDVQTWTDKSGIGNDLGSASAGVRPLYNATDAAFGGRPTVTFDGASEWLRRTTFSWGAAVDECSYLWVARGDSWVNGDRWSDYGTGSILCQDGNVSATFRAGRTVMSQSTSTVSSPRVAIFRWDRVVGTQQIFIGTTQEDSDANTNAAPMDNLTQTLCGSSTGTVPAAITVAELCIVARDVTADEITSFVAYSTALYGVS